MNSPPNSVTSFVGRCMREGSSEAVAVKLHQRGEIRLGPSKPWMPFRAVQTISAQFVEFRWHAKFRMVGFVPGSVVDCFENGRGALDAWICGLVRVAHGRGEKVDRGEAQRYLAELAWCPPAFQKNKSLRYEQLSEDLIRISVIDDQTYVDLQFNNKSEIVGAKTLTRFRGDQTQPWEGRFANYRWFGSIRLPSEAEVWWDTPHGKFLYWRAQVSHAVLL